MTPAKPLRRLFALLFLLLNCGPALAEGLTQTALSIPTRFPDGSSATLEAMVLRPDGPGPYPIAILSHGAPRNPADRAQMTPLRYLPEAREFARRGWAVVAVMRRGYGGSDGPYSESTGPCNNPDYMQSARQSSEDLRQAIRYVAAQPFADASRILAVGVSAGGLASIALSADPPPGLKAVISFAGGRGSVADNQVCVEDRLVGAFGTMGRSSRVPTLWIYSENDLFFGPDLARRMWGAFTQSGGRAEFIAAPPNGKDGHGFFGAAIPQWTPMVDGFLAKNGLVPRGTPITVSLPALPPPPELPAASRAKFPAYVEAGGNKAFAVSPDGAYGWKSGMRSLDEAQKGALENCMSHSQKGCRIAYLNDRPAGAGADMAAAAPMAPAAQGPRSTHVRLEPPPELSAAGRDKFDAYVSAGGRKAFAVSQDGAFGWKSGMPSEDAARRGALDNCAKFTRHTCYVVIVDDQPLR
ncbi:dienelactone hydrolase [Azospirillum lipoferum]|uniref:Prolyl oligopeptidase family serine peptidase n=1 Tax=Azospirillum lipoferum TaxID=193 RepID=A0A5A9GWB2_AZOLI|nr:MULTISPECIES: CocE/NonD family hydrolase [Azospirillum]KAA0597985.1 prolyl oligopeptidase family serine peptidase [Azospirillum lipoferum]MCP1609867.1 dienelactone hydrolase [Azospirillum lipoferum]MDW5534640.1 CocE/NonD family hydrolase [Azospirillum sp. NL1]